MPLSDQKVTKQTKSGLTKICFNVCNNIDPNSAGMQFVAVVPDLTENRSGSNISVV